MAKLYFRYGAMNSGKSTALMQVAHNYKERGMESVLLKPYIDTKGGDTVVSRLGISKDVDIKVKNEDNILALLDNYIADKGDVHCILVDEVQFLKKNHIDQLLELAVVKQIPVICYGLRTDFQMNGFEGSERLLLIAHSVEELKTICSCGRKALVNARKINGKFVFEGSQVAIDGEHDVEYEAVCPECYFKFRG